MVAKLEKWTIIEVWVLYMDSGQQLHYQSNAISISVYQRPWSHRFMTPVRIGLLVRDGCVLYNNVIEIQFLGTFVNQTKARLLWSFWKPRIQSKALPFPAHNFNLRLTSSWVYNFHLEGQRKGSLGANLPMGLKRHTQWQRTHLRYESVLPVASTTRGDVSEKGGAINSAVLACTPPLRAGNKFSGPYSSSFTCSMFERSLVQYFISLSKTVEAVIPLSLRWWTKGWEKSIFSQDWGRATSIKGSSATKTTGLWGNFPCLPSKASLLDFCFQANSAVTLTRDTYRRWHRQSEGKSLQNISTSIQLFSFLPFRLYSGQFDCELVF